MSGSDSEADYATAHAEALKRLKSKDPDFYEFLKENDQDLLNFGNSDDEEIQASENEDEMQASDDDSDTGKTSEVALSANKLKYIQEHITSSPTKQIIKELLRAFKFSLQQADSSNSKIHLTGNDLFNDVMKLCLVDLVPAFYSVLKISSNAKNIDVTKSKMWKIMQSDIKSYLINLLKMLSVLKEPSGLVLFLKHIVHLVPFYVKFIQLCRHLLKKMISFWCSEEETVRVLSLIIIVRTSKRLPKEYLGQVLKNMYFSYVKNTKFTSPNAWPMINFMKRSLTEVYAICPESAYEQSFIYIRQLAIHLRNAITMKKKEAFQTVYNWQYVHCLLLWGDLLCRLHDQEAFTGLVYPLVQTIIGTINLIPACKYVPLRFHLVKCLIHISDKTGIFITALPLILDVLTITDYNKKSSFSAKPLDFSCSLKVAKSKLLEAAFKQSCIAEVNKLLLEYFKIYSHSIGFPELALPAIVQIKSFLKQCKVPKYNQQLKSTLAKIEENCNFISQKRLSVSFKITDVNEIKKWEQTIQEQCTPILKLCKETEESEKLPPSKKQKIE